MMGVLSGLLFKKSTQGVFIVGADTHSGRVELGQELGLDRCERWSGKTGQVHKW
jgi:hypothetical protein